MTLSFSPSHAVVKQLCIPVLPERRYFVYSIEAMEEQVGKIHLRHNSRCFEIFSSVYKMKPCSAGNEFSDLGEEHGFSFFFFLKSSFFWDGVIQ